MNTVEIITEFDGIEYDEWASLSEIEAFALAVIETLGKTNWELSLLFCGNERIQELNQQFRTKDEPTDVLSFPLGESNGDRFLPGDIAVSLQTVEENARYFGVSPREELRRVIIHGILHLNGMDHEGVLSRDGEEREPMLALQEKILAELLTTA